MQSVRRMVLLIWLISTLGACLRDTVLPGFMDPCKTTELHAALKEGADINKHNDQGRTPLMVAAEKGCPNTVGELVAKNAYVNAQTSTEGWSALYFAAANQHDKTVRVLLDAGANVYLQDNEKRTVLMITAEQGDVSIVRLLLKQAPTTLDEQDVRGDTALSYAVRQGNVKVVALLVKRGANVNAATGGNYTVLMTAASEGHTKIARLLLDHKAQVDAQYSNGWTALMIAANKGDRDMVRLLLDYDANVQIQTSAGETARTIAERGGHEKIVQLLLQKEKQKP